MRNEGELNNKLNNIIYNLGKIVELYSPLPLGKGGENLSPQELEAEIIRRFLALQVPAFLVAASSFLALSSLKELRLAGLITSCLGVGVYTAGLIGLARTSIEYARTLKKSSNNPEGALPSQIGKVLSSPPPPDMPTGELFLMALGDSSPPLFLTLPSGEGHNLLSNETRASSGGNLCPSNRNNYNNEIVQRLQAWRNLVSVFCDPRRRKKKDSDRERATALRVITKIISCHGDAGPSLTQEELRFLAALLVFSSVIERAPQVQVELLAPILRLLEWYIKGPSPSEKTEEKFFQNLGAAIRAERLTGGRVDVNVPPSNGPWLTKEMAEGLAKALVATVSHPTEDMRSICLKDLGGQQYPYVFGLSPLRKEQQGRRDTVSPYIDLAREIINSPSIRWEISKALQDVCLSEEGSDGKPTIRIRISSYNFFLSIFRTVAAFTIRHPSFFGTIKIKFCFAGKDEEEKPIVTTRINLQDGRKVKQEVFSPKANIGGDGVEIEVNLEDVWKSLCERNILSLFLYDSDMRVLSSFRGNPYPQWVNRIYERLFNRDSGFSGNGINGNQEILPVALGN